MGFWDSIIDAIRATISGFRDEPGCPIAWQPNALAPVFFGYRDYEVVFPPVVMARLGPGDVVGGLGLPTHRARVFYPSLEGTPEGAAILSDCGRFPLIVFAHGQCQGDVDHFKKWFEIPALLARAGNIVVVPELSQQLPVGAAGDVDVVGGMIGWIRTEWEFRATALPSATGIVGHSFGGGVAAEFVRSSPGTISAFASLSGQTGEGLTPIANARMPKLFAFGSDLLMDAALVDLNPDPSGSAWASLPPAKHAAVLKDIGHFDYLRPGRVPCEGQRGACTQTPGLAAELLLMFFGRYLHPEGAPDLRPRIPASLVPPKFATLGLTTDQEFYAGGYLGAFEGVAAAGTSGRSCGVALTWDMGGGDVGTANVP